MAWDMELEQRLRATYGLKPYETTISTPVSVTTLGDGFLTEAAGKVVFTAPGQAFNAPEELPADQAAQWAGKATTHPAFAWVQGRYVGGEAANRNGAYWSTADLEVGAPTVKHGPFNWLHQSTKVVGAIVDTALVGPPPVSLQGLTAAVMERPYIAALSVAWKWVHPQEVAVLQMASDMGELYYSMECIAEQVQCLADVQGPGGQGCGESFEYLTAMTQPAKVCEHIRAKSSVRRLINPTFLGGAAVVPPAKPGWGDANAVVMQKATTMAEKTSHVAHTLDDTRWEMLMASVLAFAAATSA